MTTKEGMTVTVYDVIQAHQIEEGDQILYSNDPVEVSEKMDETDTIMVRGYSHLTGETVTYFLRPDVEVELWTA